MRKRPSWDEYFLEIARAVSLRGDCHRRQVGAVLVRPDRRIAATGYNGVPPGDIGCLQRPCPRVGKALSGEPICPGYSDCRATHAEANALLYADADAARGATLYITDRPCEGCLKLIRAAGVRRVVSPTAEYVWS